MRDAKGGKESFTGIQFPKSPLPNFLEGFIFQRRGEGKGGSNKIYNLFLSLLHCYIEP